MIKVYYDRRTNYYKIVETEYPGAVPVQLPKRSFISESYLHSKCYVVEDKDWPEHIRDTISNYIGSKKEKEEEYYLDDLMGD